MSTSPTTERGTHTTPTTDRETNGGARAGRGTNGAPTTDRARLARAVGDAVLGVPGVDRLAPGDGVEVATLFPGGKVTGIRLADPVEVHVVLDRLPVGPVAERIRVAVHEVLAASGEDRTVLVAVDDLSPGAFSPGAFSTATGPPGTMPTATQLPAPPTASGADGAAG